MKDSDVGESDESHGIVVAANNTLIPATSETGQKYDFKILTIDE